MTSPNELRPGRESPFPLAFRQAGVADAQLLRDTFIRIGDNVGKGFQTRRIPPWTPERWIEQITEKV